MHRSVFNQVESLFDEAIRLDPSTRRLFLDRVAREHSREIHDLLESLLVCDGSQTRWTNLGTPLDAPLRPHVAPAPEPAGTIMGRFRLIERLGVGGHGEVYLAEQIEPVTRRVALKMVRIGENSSEIIARFRAEQQSLALMSHPGIAAVYEAGLADEGRLYFAMEYVQGQPIDVYCDQRRLTVRQRLSLLLDACQAVQHAHQKGLIHRDLKPSNILVTERDGRATPVLIDFGIALATDSVAHDDEHPASRGGPAMGTPAYMSPEQAGAAPRDIDTRSDIYALGIVLYELLTGRTPLDVLAAPGSSLGEIRRCVVGCAPPSPQSLLARLDEAAVSAAASRQCTAGQLHRQVRGDLDAIVCKAIARDRADRYQTVEALGRDIENHLNDRPVTVGSTGTLARARKFVRRHRLAVGATLAIIGTLAVGIVITTLAMLRAERAAGESNAVNSFLQDVLTSSRATEKGATVRFVDVLAGGSDLAARRLNEYPRRRGEIHYILGYTYFNLGLYRDAQRELEQSLAFLRESAGMDDATTLRAAVTLANLFVGTLKLDQAQALAEEVAVHSAGAQDALREPYLTSQRVRCDVLLRRGDYVAAEQALQQLIPRIDAELGRDHLEAYNARISLATALSRHAVDLDPGPEIDAVREARIAVLEETLHLQQSRFGAEDAIPLMGSQRMLAEAYIDRGRYADAHSLLHTLPARIEARVGRGHSLYIEVSADMARLAHAQGDHAAAADYQLQALQACKDLLSAKHPNVLGQTRDTLSYLDAADRIDLGLTLARDLHSALEGMMGANDEITLDARAWIARFCDRAGLLDEAAAHYAAVVQGREPREYVQVFHAGHLARLGRFDEAEAALLKLSEGDGLTRGVSSTAHRDDLARMFVEVYQLWNRPEKASEYQVIIESIWNPRR